MLRRPLPKRGFILATVIALSFVMVLVASVVVSQSQVFGGFTYSYLADAYETEGATYGFAQIQGALQHNSPNPQAAGLSYPIPDVATLSNFAVPSSGYTCNGTLTQQPMNLAAQDGYEASIVAIGTEPAVVQLPSNHAAAVLTTVTDDRSLPQRFLTLYSSNYPYGLLASGGGIAVHSVRSLTAYNNDPQDSQVGALMSTVMAQGPVNIDGPLNGRAYSTTTSSTADKSGILASNWSAPGGVQPPADFLANLTTVRANLLAGPYNTTLSQALGNPTGTLTLATGMRIGVPQPESGELACSLVLAEDLLVADDSVLHIKGDLRLTGTIRLGQHATLVVDGSTTAAALSLNYTLAGSSNIAISSTFISEKGLILQGTMNRCDVTGWTPWNPVMAKYLGSLQLGAPDTTDVPGVLIVSKGALVVGSGPKMSGLLSTAGVSFGGVAQLVGAAWSTGSIDAPKTNYRYYPYFTHALVRGLKHEDLVVAAQETHPIAFAKLGK